MAHYRAVLRASLLCLALGAGVETGLCGTAAFAAEVTPYGPELEGFDYGFPVNYFQFTSQGKPLSMAYIDAAPKGAAKNRVVVLLHGKNFCGGTWENTINHLTSEGYRVIAPDQIGFCKSSKPYGYQFSFSQLAENTRALLKSLKIDRFTLVGHSMGGMLATRYALSYPDDLDHLVLVDPLGLEDWQQKGVPYSTIDAAYQQELKTSYDTIKAYQQKYYYAGSWKPENDRWVMMQAGLYAGPGKELVALNQAQTSDMIFTQPVVHELGNIKVPTTLMVGTKDRTAPGAQRAPKALQDQLGRYDLLGKEAAKAIPGAKLVEFDGLGHAPQIEAPDIFEKALMIAIND